MISKLEWYTTSWRCKTIRFQCLKVFSWNTQKERRSVRCKSREASVVGKCCTGERREAAAEEATTGFMAKRTSEQTELTLRRFGKSTWSRWCKDTRRGATDEAFDDKLAEEQFRWQFGWQFRWQCESISNFRLFNGSSTLDTFFERN